MLPATYYVYQSCLNAIHHIHVNAAEAAERTYEYTTLLHERI